MRAGEEFVLSFIHSVNRRPVYDTIRMARDHLVVVSNPGSTAFGAGMPEHSTEEGTLPGGRGRLDRVDDQPPDAGGGGPGRPGGQPHAPPEGSGDPFGRSWPRREPRWRCGHEPIRGLISGKAGASGERQRAAQSTSPSVRSMSDIKSDVSEEELTKLLAKVDKESTFRKLTGYQYRMVYWIAVAFSCFQLYTGCSGTLPRPDPALTPPVLRLRARLPALSLPHQERPQQAARA